MRTTVDLSPELMREAKAYAARQGITLRTLFEEAVRRVLAETPRRERIDLPVARTTGGYLPGVDIANNAEVRDIMDGLR